MFNRGDQSLVLLYVNYSGTETPKIHKKRPTKMNMSHASNEVIRDAFGAETVFISENRSKTNITYVEARTGGKKAVYAQKPLQSLLLCNKAGKGGALV